MVQTFSKTIEGHNLEFNRLLYPVRYVVTSHDEKYQGTRVEIVRDKDVWCVSKAVNVPDCFYHIQNDICNAVTNNELKETTSLY